MTRSRAASASWHDVVLALASALAVAAFTFAVVAPAHLTGDAAVRELTTTIRCPTCIGESIADSTAPLASAMRDEAERRLAAGESPDEVRRFFVDAYGAEVLLSPPVDGPGALVWVAPVTILVVAAAALTVMAVAQGRRRSPSPTLFRRPMWMAAGAVVVGVSIGAVTVAVVDGAGEQGAASSAARQGSALGPIDALAAAVKNAPADADLRLALAHALVSEGEPRRAADHVAAAYRLRPTDPDVGHRYASVLLQQGEVDAAAKVLDSALDTEPQHMPALLLRGVMLWNAGDSRGVELLQRYLALSPEGAAADDVRELLGQDPEP